MAIPMSAGSSVSIAAQIVGIEWIVVLIVIAVLLLFGPKKLPELARGMGKALGEFRRGKMEIERQISSEISEFDAKEARARVDRAASALGIPTTGRSELQIKIEIARAIDQAAEDQVVAAARAMAVYSSGADTQSLREQIVKALNV